MARKWSRPAFAGWLLLAVNAVGTGVISLRYALPHVPFAAPLPNFLVRHGWLITHAICSSIALLTGVWQFLPGLRRRRLTLHRWMGRVYCAAVLVGWAASLPIASHAQTGAVASAGFLTLGAFWIGTTATAWFTIRRGNVQAHRRWMIRSYALTAAAITLRTYLPTMTAAGISFSISYPLVAWICWIPNLLFAEWMVRRVSPQPSALSRQPQGV